MLEGFLRKIYDGFDSSREIEPTAWREVLRILNEGAVEGLSRSPFYDYEKNFLRNIRHSNEVFSAFKVHSWASLMQERLLDEEGKLRPFKEWKKLVAPISNHHVGSWLKTEYDTAIIRAHQASQWQEFEANKDIFPNLRWMPTTSPSPELLHKGFAGSKLTKPVNDPFWEVHHPGNRWNCKCSLNATDEPVSEGIDDDVDTKTPSAQRGLENNPKDGQLFSDKHPYFPENCNACPFYRRGKGVKNWVKGLFENREKDCSTCPHIDLEVAKAKYPENYAEYLRYLNDPDYKEVEFDPISGGVKATHKGHKLNDTHEQRYFQAKLSPQALERACHNALFKQGNRTILLNEKEKKDDGDFLTGLDLSLNGEKMDIRSITKNNSNYVNALTDKDKQLKKYNSRSDVVEKVDSLCLYFHDASMYSDEKMAKTIERYRELSRQRGRAPRIKRLYIVINGYENLIMIDI